VDPRDAVLSDRDPSSPYTMGVTRDIVTRLSTGDVIWATGVLTRQRDQGDGAYRSGVTRRRLLAPRRGRIALGPESPLPRWQALARAHKLGGLLAAGALAVLHLTVYRGADVALFEYRVCGLPAGPDPFPAVLFGAIVGLAVTALGWRALVVRTKLRPVRAARRR